MATAAPMRIVNRPSRVCLEQRMKYLKRIGLPSLALACAAAIVLTVFVVAAGRAEREVRAVGDRQLQIIALDLESALEKFETLPFALAFHPALGQALGAPQDREALQRLNLTLQTIQRQAKVSAIYLMDRNGDTLVASNWDEPLTFVGKNFGFRPYFRDALEGRAGRFYGIGSTTGEPGYFIAQPVYPNGVPGPEPIGVIAVKISLSEFEHTWSRSEEPLVLVDHLGVIFLSNRDGWRYRSLHTLSQQERHYVTGTFQYAGQAIQPVAALPKAQRAGFGDYVAKPVGRLGWQVMLFPAQNRILRTASYSALAAALVLAVVVLSSWAVHQRRRRLEERLASRRALQRAAEELDRTIAQRTQELRAANHDLESKYQKLQQTEHLLRSTQNELVQAGKLATLGQMAAGITHELNQPLAAIRAFADNAVTFLARGRPAQAGDNLAHISAAAARMGEIIGQLKGFARKSRDAVAAVDLAQSIRESAMLLGGDFRRRQAQLEIDMREPLQVTGDPVRTEQVLINLLRNALDAVDGAPQRQVCVLLQREGGQAVVRIRDSGPGIEQDAVERLFEPFFTTKPPGQGLGLGLAISSSIVQAMDGQLSAHNRPEGGAEFVMRLPLRQDGGAAQQGEQRAGS